MSRGYTAIDNEILEMNNLSLEALALYIKIKRHITKKNWIIQRESVKRESGLGEYAFRRVWKELQEAGLLISERKRVNGKFLFEFTLVTSINQENEQDEKNSTITDVKKDENTQSGVYKEDTLPVVQAETTADLMEAVNLSSDIMNRFIQKYGIEVVMKARFYLHTIVQRKPIRNVYNYLKQTINNGWYLEIA